MEALRQWGIICIVIVIAMEIGAIISNVSAGLPAFYLFDFKGRFSADNSTFLIYWAALIAIFLNIYKD